MMAQNELKAHQSSARNTSQLRSNKKEIIELKKKEGLAEKEITVYNEKEKYAERRRVN